MELHRTTGHPGWEAVSEADRTGWQRLAARTDGMVTPGNILTIIGFLLVLAGLGCVLGHHYWPALCLIAGGRLFDIADGWAAERTGTKSPLGEAFDVNSDKLGTLFTVIAFAISHVAPLWTLLAILGINIVISVVGLVQILRNHIVLHPTRIGKLSMTLASASLGSYLLLRACNVRSDNPVHLAIGLAVIASVVLGICSSVQYSRVHLHKPNEKPVSKI